MPLKLKRGYTFHYNRTTWKVTDIYKIKWADGSKSVEYKVKGKNGNIRYLEIETSKDNKESFSFWEKITNKTQFLSKFKNLKEDFFLVGKTKFPKKIDYNGLSYRFDEQNKGVLQNLERESVNSVDYISRAGTELLSFEIWSDEVEVSYGRVIKESQISKIEKGSSSVISSSIVEKLGDYIGVIVVFGFLLVSLTLNKCSSGGSWSSDSKYSNDSTKVHRSNNVFRARSSSGFGK